MTRMKRCLPTILTLNTSKSSDARLLKNDCQNFSPVQSTARASAHCSPDFVFVNKLRSSVGIRVRCEHIFGRMSQMAFRPTQVIGLAPANQHIGLSNLDRVVKNFFYNISFDRNAFLCK